MFRVDHLVVGSRHGVDGRDRGAGGRFALYIVATKVLILFMKGDYA